MNRGRLACSAITALALLGVLLVQPGTASATEPMATAICVEAESECAEENLYPVETELTALSTNLRIETEAGAFACEGTELEGETIADYGYPLPIEISSISFSGCTFAGVVPCLVKALGLPLKGWLDATEGEQSFEVVNGAGEGGEVSLQAECGAATCTFSGEPDLSFTGGEALELAASEELLVSGAGCPGGAFLSANYAVKSGGEGVYATEYFGDPVRLLPPNPLVKKALQIPINGTRKVQVKNERLFELVLRVNTVNGNFALKPAPETTCVLNGLVVQGMPCEDAITTVNGAAAGNEDELKVVVENHVVNGLGQTIPGELSRRIALRVRAV